MDNGFLDFVLDQLSGLPAVTSKHMFGGAGLYQSGVFFAIIASGRLYFLTNEETRLRYEENGMKAFQPNPDQVLRNYYEVPVDVLEDDVEIARWAAEAVAVQRAKSGAGEPTKKRRKKGNPRSLKE